MKYRTQLYSNYGELFGGQKSYAPEGQNSLFDAVYPTLPEAKSAAIVDIGCGKGEWLNWLQSKGYSNLTGVDVTTSEIEEAFSNTKGVEFKEGDAIRVLEDSSTTYDVIHCKDLIEHLTKDEIVTFLIAAHSALNPGGYILVSTFNAQSAFSSSTWCGDFTHETALTPNSLAQVLRACKFKDIRVSGYVPAGGGGFGLIRKVLGRAMDLWTRGILIIRRGRRSEGHVQVSSGMPDMIAQAWR